MSKRTIAIDLAKDVFQVVVLTERGRVVERKRVKRNKLAAYVARQEPSTVVMEACAGAHYWGRCFRELGHEAKLIAPQFVKPYRKGQKNDPNDADAIGEASQRATMRFVGVKSVEQQEVQVLHRCRERIKGNRTQVSNQVRGILAEFGIVMAKSNATFARRIPEILEDGENKLTDRTRAVIAECYQEWQELGERLERLTGQIEALASEDERIERLRQELRGVGPLSATALFMAVADIRAFANGRQFAGFVGLVPRQHSSGDRIRLLGIKKGGQVYLRQLLIHGARAVIRHLGDKQDKLSCWLRELVARRGKNVAAVALANKNARQAWAILARAA